MRALFFNEKFVADEKVLIEGRKHHHLRNVIRAKEGESLLLLNGEGRSFICKIAEIKNKETVLTVISEEIQKRNLKIPHVAVCLTKKDSFEECLRIAIEVGCEKIFPLTSQYSQNYEVKETRLERVLESAYEQSNNPYTLDLYPLQSIERFSFDLYDEVILYDSTGNHGKTQENREKSKVRKRLILIGPEGGFSQKEVEKMNSLKNCKIIHLRTNILRTPTALSFALGQQYLF